MCKLCHLLQQQNLNKSGYSSQAALMLNPLRVHTTIACECLVFLHQDFKLEEYSANETGFFQSSRVVAPKDKWIHLEIHGRFGLR